MFYGVDLTEIHVKLHIYENLNIMNQENARFNRVISYKRIKVSEFLLIPIYFHKAILFFRSNFY